MGGEAAGSNSRCTLGEGGSKVLSRFIYDRNEKAERFHLSGGMILKSEIGIPIKRNIPAGEIKNFKMHI